MKLTEIDWDGPQGATDVQVEYPDRPIAEFVNFMRRTKAWLENPEIVERRVRRLNDDLRAHRERPVVVEDRVLQPLPTNGVIQTEAYGELRLANKKEIAAENRRAALKRGREAKARKKAEREAAQV